MPDLFEEYGALELDKLKEKMAAEEIAPKEPETADEPEAAEQPEKPAEPERPGLSRRAKIVYAAVAAAAVVIVAAIFGIPKYQDWKAVDRCRQAIADFQSLGSYHVRQTSVRVQEEEISDFWKTADGVLQLYDNSALVTLADGQCYRATFTGSMIRVEEDGTVRYERNPASLSWNPTTVIGSAGPFWLSEYEWQEEDVTLVSREKTDEGQTVVLQFDGAPNIYLTGFDGEVTEYTVSFCFDGDGALTSAEIRYCFREAERIYTTELLPASEEEIEEVFLSHCQDLMAKLETDTTYLPLIHEALEDFRYGAYSVSEDFNGKNSFYIYDGSRWLCKTPSGYYKLWIDGTEYVGNTAGVWGKSSSADNGAMVPWLRDYELYGSSTVTFLEAEETADGQIITLLMEDDNYWKSDDSSYTACFTLNGQDELTQVSFTYALLGIEYTRTLTIEEVNEEEITAMIDSVFTDAYLKSDAALAPLNLCRQSIYNLAKEESFHIQWEVSRSGGVSMSKVNLAGNSYWHGSRGASECYTVVNGEQALYSLTLYQDGYTQYWHSVSNINGSGSASGQYTAIDVIEDCLPQYDWLSEDITLLATESTGTGVNILFLIEGRNVRTNVCFTLDNGLDLVSITETTSDQTVTCRVVDTDAEQISAAIDSVSDRIVEDTVPDAQE